MSYQSTIDAMDIDANPIGSPGSALKNPAIEGAAGLNSDPMISGLFQLMDTRIANANTAVSASQQTADDAYDPVVNAGMLNAIPDQIAAYNSARNTWQSNLHDPNAYAAYAAARDPLYQAGVATATPDQLAAIDAGELDIGQARVEVSDAIQYKADTQPMFQQQVDALTHGDPTAPAGSPEALGVVNHAGEAMKDMPSTMAILSGGQAAVDHIARVDAPTGAPPPADPSVACSADSLIRRGLKAITDAGKLLLDTAKAIAKSIGDVLGPIAQWTADMLKALGGVIKNVLQAAGQLLKAAMTTFIGWVRDAADAVAKALKTALNKAFLAFFGATDACMKDHLKETININNVDQAALDKASMTA